MKRHSTTKSAKPQTVSDSDPLPLPRPRVVSHSSLKTAAVQTSSKGTAARTRARDERASSIRLAFASGQDEDRIVDELVCETALTPAQARREVRTVRRRLVTQYLKQCGAAEHVAVSLLQHNHLIARAMEDGDARIALSAIDSRDKLLGLLQQSVMSQESDARVTSLLDLLQQMSSGGASHTQTDGRTG